MINRFITYRSILDQMNSQPYIIRYINATQQIKLGSKKYEFTNTDWCQITDLNTALKPFFCATNIMSAKNYPTLAAAYSGELHISTLLRSHLT
jgi:hypothetical protein